MRDVRGPAEKGVETRITAFVSPFSYLLANGDIGGIVVPLSSTRTMFWHIFWSETEKINEEPYRTKHLEFLGLPGTA